MSAYVARATCTSFRACRINAQIVHPAASQLVKPNELESALARPLNVAVYEPERHATYLAATLSYGIINGAVASISQRTPSSFLSSSLGQS